MSNGINYYDTAWDCLNVCEMNIDACLDPGFGIVPYLLEQLRQNIRTFETDSPRTFVQKPGFYS